MEKKLFKMELTDEVEGVFAISLVEEPAIKSDFIYLSKEKVTLAVLDADKRIVTGAVLIPDIQILRADKNGEPYYITWDKETIEASAFKFMNEYNQKNVTLDHAVKLDAVTVFESWIKASEYDKSVGLGIDVPVGTWMVSMKVNDDILWDLVKDGMVKGFSIEGHFKPVSQSEINNLKSEKMKVEESMNPIAMIKQALGIGEVESLEETPAVDPAELPPAGTRWAFTEELYNDLVQRIEVLETAAMLKEVKPEDIKPEASVEATVEATVETTVEAAEVIEPTVETVEASAEPEVEPEVEMLSYTDVPSTKVKKVKFNSRMSTQERIKAQLGLD